MRRQPALIAEVRGCSDEPAAEQHGPIAIHDHTGRQRMARVHEPARKPEPILRQTRREVPDRPGCARSDAHGRRIVRTARQDECRPRRRQLPHGHHFRQSRENLVLLATKVVSSLNSAGNVAPRGRCSTRPAPRAAHRCAGIRVCAQHGSRGILGARQYGNVQRRQRTVVDAQLVYRHVLQRLIVTAADPQRRVVVPVLFLLISAPDDAALQVIDDNARARELAVEEEPKAARPARAVVGQGEVVPSAWGERPNVSISMELSGNTWCRAALSVPSRRSTIS